MPLPDEITTQKVRAISDLCNNEEIQDAIDDAMGLHMDQVLANLSRLYELSHEQEDELAERLMWRLELAPVPPSPPNAELAG